MRFQEAIVNLKFKRETKFSLIGTEQYLKELFIKTAKSVYSDITLMEFFPEDQNEALSVFSSGSFFGGQLLIFNDFNKMKIESFSEMIPSFEGVLVLVITEKADLSSRIMSGVTGQTTMVECNKLREYGNDYPLWVRNQINEAGYSAGDGVENQFFSKIGPNMFVLANELEKLFMVKDDKIITAFDINRITSVTAVSTAFEIFENLMKRDIGQALKCFNSFARSQENLIDIVAFIGSYLEKMYRILLLRDQKFEVDDIADIVGIPRFMVKLKYLPKALGFGKDGIAAKIDAVCNLDVRLRSFKGDKNILVEKFIMEFTK